MAVPKKRTGHSAQGKRRSNWKASKPEITTCPNCGAKVLTHTVCTACGTYKGKVVSKKAEGYVEEVKEEKKEIETKTVFFDELLLQKKQKLKLLKKLQLKSSSKGAVFRTLFKRDKGKS